MAKCLVAGCVVEPYKRDLCNSHYIRWRRYGKADEPHRRKASWGGVRCSEPGCERGAKVLGRCSMHHQQHTRAKDPVAYKARLSKAKLVRRAEKEELIGRPRPDHCEVCGQHKSRSRRGIVFDHCHETNAPRGWLCNTCNRLLGWVKDDPIILRKLAAYLDTHRKK